MMGVKLGAMKLTRSVIVCVTGDENGEESCRKQVPVTSPDATIEGVNAFFVDAEVEAICVIAAVPLDLTPGSQHYGDVVGAALPEWENVDLVANFEAALRVPIGCVLAGQDDDGDVGAALKKAAGLVRR
jgi:predicted NBD/HSP70 family sugar kinase